ncbi:MAG: family 10 glycosylhydrolase, partial [Candidatus Marinimicrobia bacterium]|nr:family 10 glycosylhydrolase [Candidatus Neomarinimicrobiota bacterium]
MNRVGNTCRRAAVAALLFLFNNPVFADTFDVRALWIVRDHIITAEKIDDVIEFAERNNYNHLFVQIRGRGDAYYTSRVVPRSHLLAGTDFDPLAYIIKKARHYNIAIHAWFNVYYLWSSLDLPAQQDHLLYTQTTWLDTEFPDPINVQQTLEAVKQNKNANGEGFYLAPTHPEVEAHLQN